ncbi:MAG TPA: hypothetical protein VIM16_19315 [Mucilaginibacter sp.]|jgi:hypothetical protein
MKAFKILTLIVLCSIIHLNKIYAQKDYVITSSKDTIFCDIRGSFFSNNLKYRANKKDKFTPITSADIIEYFLADDTTTFVAKSLPRKVYRYTPYLKLLERGRINLYDQQVASGSQGQTTSFWYASKGSDSLKLIKVSGITLGGVGSRKQREQAFMDLISDFPSLLEGFKTKAYTFENIQDCIVVYNSEYLINNKFIK